MKKPRCISVGVKFRCYLREASEQLFLSFIFVKFSLINSRKYGVVVEGQTMVLEFDGSSPGHDSFEKVINSCHIWLHFVFLN
jgi:hypothetical protein